MLEEAMAQLNANQEKISESEGNGPTWEDKVHPNDQSLYYLSKNLFTPFNV